MQTDCTWIQRRIQAHQDPRREVAGVTTMASGLTFGYNHGCQALTKCAAPLHTRARISESRGIHHPQGIWSLDLRPSLPPNGKPFAASLFSPVYFKIKRSTKGCSCLPLAVTGCWIFGKDVLHCYFALHEPLRSDEWPLGKASQL